MYPSVPYPPSTSFEPCPPVLLTRSVHDASQTDLCEERKIAATNFRVFKAPVEEPGMTPVVQVLANQG